MRAGIAEAPDVARHEGDLRVLFVDFAQAFGGSILSLREMIRGFRSVDPVVVMFLDDDHHRKLYRGIPTFCLRQRINYQMKARFNRFRSRFDRIPLASKLLFAPVALLEWLEVQFLSRRIARIAQTYDVDLLYANNGYSGIVSNAASLADVPHVAHFRLIPPPSTRKYIAADDLPAVFAVSEAVGSALRECGVEDERVEVVPNAVDVTTYDEALGRRTATRAMLDVPDGVPALGLFGRVTRWKGHHVFIEALKRLHERGHCFRAFIVGDSADTGPDYLDRMYEESRPLREAGMLTFCGYRPDVAEHYAAMDIVVHCSVEPEPFGRVVIEGMAADAAVVAMREGGPLDTVEHGRDGLLVPPRRPEALADTLSRLMDDHDLRRRLRRAGRGKVRSRYSPEAVARTVERRLRAALGLEERPTSSAAADHRS